jgi:hypothetical protein
MEIQKIFAETRNANIETELKLFVALKKYGKAGFQNLVGLVTEFFSLKTFTVIHDSMQFDELIPNITLVLR